MKGEICFFRKRFFGGFNREDVISYIATISQERNELMAAKEKAEEELRELIREVATLRFETEVAWRLTKETKETIKGEEQHEIHVY